MADCDASVVASQSAVLFGLVAIAAVGFGLGWKGFSFGLLCGFCMLTDWAAFSPKEGPRCPALLWGGKRRAVRWATQRAALGDAAHCDGTCSALRHLTGNAALWRVLLKVGACTRLPVRHGVLLYWSPNAAGIPAFAPRNIGLGGSGLFRHAVCRLQGWAGGVLPLLLGCPKKKAWHTPRGAAMLLLGWAIRFRTRTKTTKMSCATITP